MAKREDEQVRSDTTLRNPKGAKRLLDSIAQVRAGNVTEHKLIDDADQVL